VNSFQFELSDDDLDRLADRIADRLNGRTERRDERTAYTCQTLAAELGISPRAVRAAIGRGDLQAVRRGRGWMIGADAVAAWTTPSGARRRAAPRAANVRPLRDAFSS
jgi:excisionase family DNA binding protein